MALFTEQEARAASADLEARKNENPTKFMVDEVFPTIEAVRDLLVELDEGEGITKVEDFAPGVLLGYQIAINQKGGK